MPDSEASDKVSPIFGRLLRFWREGFAMTQESLAEIVDTSQRHISRLENGLVRPSDDMVARLASAFELRERDRDLLAYAANTKGNRDPVSASSETPPWLDTTLSRLLQAIEPAPACVTNASAQMIKANSAWHALFADERQGKTPADMALFWEAVFAAGERHQPQGWLLSRLGLLMSFRQMAILRENPDMEALYRRIRETYEFPDEWVRAGARFDPRVSFPIVLESNGSLSHWDFVSFGVDEAGVATARESAWWLYLLLPRE